MTITISKRAELRLTTSRMKITLRCLRRAILLILLGLMLNSMHSKSLSDFRFPGVLQLLAVSYFVCATLETIFMKPHSQVRRSIIFYHFQHLLIFNEYLYKQLIRIRYSSLVVSRCSEIYWIVGLSGYLWHAS